MPLEPSPRVLSVVMPCFNEADTVREVVKEVLASELVGELVIVDDASTDATSDILAELGDPRVRVLVHEVNRGKGAALRTAFAAAALPYVIVQDADLEYDPAEYRSCCSRCSTDAPTSSTARGSSAAPNTACCTSGTRSATDS